MQGPQHRTRLYLVGGTSGAREALAFTLGGEPELELAGDTGNLNGLAATVAAAAPDVVLVDWPSSDVDAVLACRALRDSQPAIRIGHLVTQVSPRSLLLLAFAKGHGLLLKVIDPTELTRDVRALEREDGTLRTRAASALLSWHASRSAKQRSHGTSEDHRLFRLLVSDATDHDVAQEVGLDRLALDAELARVYLELYHASDFARTGAALARLMAQEAEGT